MIEQFILQLFPIIITGFLTYLACTAGTSVRSRGKGISWDISWMLPDTLARNEFNLFVLQAVIAVTVLVCALLQVSNHIIISMDILYILSLSMLYLYHTLKVADSLHLTEDIR